MTPTGDADAPAKWATSPPASRTCASARWATRSHCVANPAAEPLPGYRPAKPMVFAGLYPVESDEYRSLRDALEKLQLNDASLVYEPESSDGARLRLPLRLPGPAAHGDHPASGWSASTTWSC